MCEKLTTYKLHAGEPLHTTQHCNDLKAWGEALEPLPFTDFYKLVHGVA